MRALAAAAAAVTLACASAPRSSLEREPTGDEMAQLWIEPEDISKRDLFDGPGGPALRPKPGATYQFLSKDTAFEIRLPSRGYYFVLDPPLPVNVLEGEIKGDAKKPIAGYIAEPWGKYPPGLPVPAAPEGADAKAGGGGGGE